jgi:hypothetical protein
MLPIETHQEALRQYIAGVPLKVTAHELGMHQMTIVALAKRSGVPLRLKANPKHAEIMRLHRLLYKPKYIASRVGCTTRTVHNVIKRAAS